MTNNELVLENFISFCDEMMIAEESLSSINANLDRMSKELENIEKKAKRALTVSDIISNLEQSASCVRNTIKLIENDNIDDSELKKMNLKAKVKTIIGSVVSIIGSIGFGVLAAKNSYEIDKDKPAAVVTGIAGATLTGAISSIGVKIAKNKIKNGVEYKASIIDKLNETLTGVDSELTFYKQVQKLGCKDMDEFNNSYYVIDDGDDIEIYAKEKRVY